MHIYCEKCKKAGKNAINKDFVHINMQFLIAIIYRYVNLNHEAYLTFLQKIFIMSTKVPVWTFSTHNEVGNLLYPPLFMSTISD